MISGKGMSKILYTVCDVRPMYFAGPVMSNHIYAIPIATAAMAWRRRTKCIAEDQYQR